MLPVNDVPTIAEHALQALADEREVLQSYSNKHARVSECETVRAICDRTDKSIDRLAKTVSTTLMDVATKARVVLARDYCEMSEDLIRSILRDIVCLAGNT